MSAHRYWRIKINANSASNIAYVLLCEVKMYLRGTSTNAIGGGTASASGSNSTAGNACDGSTSTYWEYTNSNVYPQWWQYDFGAGNAKDIGQIDISSYSSWANEMPTDFEIQWSDDGAAFTTMFRAQRLLWAVNQTFSFPVPDTGDTKKYALRLNVTATNGAAYASVAELAVRSVAGGANLATGKVPIDTADTAGTLAQYAFDGVTTTTWEPPNGTTPAAVGFISPTAIVPAELAITVSSSTAANRTAAAPKDFSLQGSTDGVTWTTIQSYTGQTGWAVGETRTFAIAAQAVAARPQVFVCT